MKKKLYFLFVSAFIVLLFINLMMDLNNAKLENKRHDKLVNTSDLDSWYQVWGGEKSDYGRDIVVDSLNNIYIAGTTESFGSGNTDIGLLKFNSSGGLKWNTTWGGNRADYAGGLALDSENDIYVVGETYNYGADGGEICLIKFTNSGSYLWNSTWGGDKNERAWDVVIDKDDNVYITGFTTSFGSGREDIILLKFNCSGSLQWNITWGGDKWDEERGYALTLDSVANVYIVGEQRLSSSDYITSDDIVLLKYSSSGVLEWNCTWGQRGKDSANGVIMDSIDNIYVSGSTRVYGNVDFDALIIKFDTLGNELWNYTWGGKKDEHCFDIALDSNEDVHVVGDRRVLESSPYYLIPTDVYMEDHLYTLKLDSSGRILRSCVWSGFLNVVSSAIALDANDNIYITGVMYNISNPNQWDLLLVKNPKPCEVSEKLISGFSSILILNMIGISVVILNVVKLRGKIKISVKSLNKKR